MLVQADLAKIHASAYNAPNYPISSSSPSRYFRVRASAKEKAFLLLQKFSTNFCIAQLFGTIFRSTNFRFPLWQYSDQIEGDANEFGFTRCK